MEKERISIELGFDKEVIEKINNFIQFINTYHKIYKNEDWKKGALENFIRGSVNREIEKIENLNPKLTGINKKIPKGVLKNRIKEIMKEKKIKQLEMASITGIDRSNISLIMNNHVQPTSDHLIRIHAALNFPPLDEMFYREESDK
ncbi:helix-turn-helix domain-containing protein [Fictibacillus nanhaiensis]|uniref:helix-turn-helix domain-containing protein n=1 Tax=Fictibacillus nanhaiensis TaxID=742169 RepID=UPI002E20127E|nr:helix-turn-helix domain-containing protein [Fictibacillus nanhaiensis]